jgi:hypothetical protein
MLLQCSIIRLIRFIMFIMPIMLPPSREFRSSIIPWPIIAPDDPCAGGAWSADAVISAAAHVTVSASHCGFLCIDDSPFIE